MEKTQIKDALRNIGKQKVSFLSIVVIAMFAVAAYLGINTTASSLSKTANSYYDKSSYRDIELISTLLLTPDDIEALKYKYGISDIEGVMMTSGIISKGEKRTNADVISLTKRINLPILVEGSLPSKETECVIDKVIADECGLKPGDTVKLSNKFGENAKYLRFTSFEITGIVYHPDHFMLPVQYPGNRYVIVTDNAFDTEQLDGCFMKAEIQVAGVRNMSRFSRKYKKLINETSSRIKEITDERTAIRSKMVRDAYQSEIDKAEKDLEKAKADLEKGRTDLDNGWKDYYKGKEELENAQKTIAENEVKLTDGKVQLDAAKVKLEAGEKTLKDSKKTLESAKKELDAAKKELTAGYKQIDAAKEKIRTVLKKSVTEYMGANFAKQYDWSKPSSKFDVDDSSLSAEKFKIAKGVTINLKLSMKANIVNLLKQSGLDDASLRLAYLSATGKALEVNEDEDTVNALARIIEKSYNKKNNQYDKLASAARKWDSAHKEYISGLKKYKDGLEKYNSGLKTFNKNKSDYGTALEKYNTGVTELENGKKEVAENQVKLADGLKELEQGEIDYKTGMWKYKDGVSELGIVKSDFENLDDCRWVVFDGDDLTGIALMENNIKNVSNMGTTFAMVFVVVGALVIYATVGKIIDEQRKLVGTTKALGLYNREIFAKYLVFGVSATVMGVILGAVIGCVLLQNTLLNGYSLYQAYGGGVPTFEPGLTIIVLLSGIALSSATVWLACSGLMRSTAIKLMQEKAPSSKRRNSKSMQKVSLYNKLILRNMVDDKKRVAVTIACITGSCALLVTGFSMKFSISSAIEKQFSDILRYDQLISYDIGEAPNADTDLSALFDKNGAKYLNLYTKGMMYEVDDSITPGFVFVSDLDELNAFYSRLDEKTGDPLPADAEGVWINSAIQQKTGLKAGDEMILFGSTMDPHKVKVAGVYRLYIGSDLIMSIDSYEKIFGAVPVNNSYLVADGDADPAALISEAKTVKGFDSVTDMKQTKADYIQLTGVLDLMSLILTFIAGFMAYFILLNLVNMYLNQKRKELTVMRINGFTVKEVIGYVSRESFITTGIGIILGLISGSLLAMRMLELIQSSGVNSPRGIQWLAWLLAAVITILFSVIINSIAMRKIKYLKLSDAA